MKCPFCGNNEDKVIDSRETNNGASVRRRRECLSCARRFTTYENIEEMPFMVVKKDGRREPFDRNKILSGLIKACQKRPVSISKLEELVSDIERSVQKKFEHEIDSRQLGEIVIEALARTDEIAYVRFASVYRQFKDINQFMRELRDILGKKIK